MFRITLFFHLFLLIKLNSSSYCDFNKYCPNNEKHIACEPFEKSRQESEYKNVKFIEIPIEVKRQVLTSLNNFRNKLAYGIVKDASKTTKRKDVYFEKASKMRFIRWSNDFEAFATLALINFRSYEKPCCVTENFKNPHQQIFNVYRLDQRYTVEFAFREMIRTWLMNAQSRDDNFGDLILNENLFQIGCAYATYSYNIFDPSHGHLIKCIFNQETLDLKSTVYTKGDMCSDCYDYDEECNQLFKGLCGRFYFFVYFNYFSINFTCYFRS